MPAHWITYRYTTGPGTAVAAIHVSDRTRDQIEDLTREAIAHRAPITLRAEHSTLIIPAPHLVDIRIDPANQAAARNLFDPPRHLPPMPS